MFFPPLRRNAYVRMHKKPNLLKIRFQQMQPNQTLSNHSGNVQVDQNEGISDSQKCTNSHCYDIVTNHNDYITAQEQTAQSIKYFCYSSKRNTALWTYGHHLEMGANAQSQLSFPRRTSLSTVSMHETESRLCDDVP